MFDEEDDSEDEKVIVVEDYDLVHEKVRHIAYWHFIYTNNNKKLPNLDNDKFKATKKFKDELKLLLPEKESDVIFKGFIHETQVGQTIKFEEFSQIVRDLSIRVCSNVLRELSKKDIVSVIWDESVENFAFQISPEYLDSNIKTPKQFLKHVYFLAKKHLKLKDHSDFTRKKK